MTFSFFKDRVVTQKPKQKIKIAASAATIPRIFVLTKFKVGLRRRFKILTFFYSANKIEPKMIRIPVPAPTRVGQFVPELGSEGEVGVGVGDDVPEHVQFVTLGQLGLRQYPL